METLPLSYGERGGKVKRRGACAARFQATIARDRAMELRVQPSARSVVASLLSGSVLPSPAPLPTLPSAQRPPHAGMGAPRSAPSASRSTPDLKLGWLL